MKCWLWQRAPQAQTSGKLNMLVSENWSKINVKKLSIVTAITIIDWNRKHVYDAANLQMNEIEVKHFFVEESEAKKNGRTMSAVCIPLFLIRIFKYNR